LALAVLPYLHQCKVITVLILQLVPLLPLLLLAVAAGVMEMAQDLLEQQVLLVVLVILRLQLQAKETMVE
jgi:hypothetical protein